MCPSDSSGNYSLPLGYLAVTGATIQASQHNPPLEDIGAALSARLSTNGAAPMSAPLKLADGAVGLPAATFQSAPSTGLYKTTGGIGVAIGGVKVAEFLAGGVIGARFIGELISFTCTAAPALTVMPFGQTLNRITYAALWAQAQIEIAAGNTFYNNGDGSITFGVGDMRGRVPAAWDKMGGVAAGRLTTAGGGVDGATLGAVGGAQNATLAQSALPNVAPTFSGATSTLDQGNILQFTGAFVSTVPNTGGTTHGFNNADPVKITPTVIPSGTISSLNGGVTQTPVNLAQPTLVTNYLLFAGA